MQGSQPGIPSLDKAHDDDDAINNINVICLPMKHQELYEPVQSCPRVPDQIEIWRSWFL